MNINLPNTCTLRYYIYVFCLLYVFAYFFYFLSSSGLDASQRQGLLLLVIIGVFFNVFNLLD